MGFPNIIFGADGQQFAVDADPAADQGSPSVGDQMIFDDGRKFRYSSAGAVAVVVGKLYQAPIPVPNHVLQTAAAAAVGATSVALTLGATAATANQYHNGMLVVDLASNTGFGYGYGIGHHPAVASAGVFTVPLKSTVQVAIAATANSVSLVPNTHQGVILAVATNPTARIAGVSVKPLPIGDFGWIQTRGPCMCLGTGTLVIGTTVIPSSTTGAVIAQVTAVSLTVPQVGVVIRVATTTDYSTIYLEIDG